MQKIHSQDSGNDSEQVPITGRPSVNSPRGGSSGPKEPNCKLRLGLAIMCCFGILMVCGALFKIKYDSVMEDRETVDTRVVVLTHPVTDYSVEPSVIHNCNITDSCSYDCETVRDKFLEYKKACEYKDYFHALKIIGEIFLVLGLIGCICGKD